MSIVKVLVGLGGWTIMYSNRNNLNASFITALSQNLHLSSPISGCFPQTTTCSHVRSPSLLHHIFYSKYALADIDFYLASHLSVSSTQPITYNFRYHIEITTSMSTYLYTNLYNYASSRAIAIEVLPSKPSKLM